MKLLIACFIPLFLLTSNNSSFAQSTKFSQVYKPGGTLYVYSENGLSLRDKPDAKGIVAVVAKFGETVEVLPDKNPRISFTSTGVPGSWVKVKNGDKEGYMFDGFLSRYPPMPPTKGYPKDFQDYLKMLFKVKTFTDTPPEKETYNAYVNITFENGITYSHIAGEGGAGVDVSFPVSVYTFQEVYLISRIAYAEFFKAPASCTYKEDLMECNVDENTSLTIIKKGQKYEVSYGFSD